MKKLIALLLALSMLFVFAGCDKEPEVTEPAEETLPEGVMTHEEFIAAELNTEVTVHTYVQAYQSWWDGAMRIYAQSKDGGYFLFDVPCTEDEAAKLVPGTKLEVTGYKVEWEGLVEIDKPSYKILEGSWIAEATDVTSLMGTEDLAKHMNELVAVKGLTVAASKDADGNEVPSCTSGTAPASRAMTFTSMSPSARTPSPSPWRATWWATKLPTLLSRL